MSLEYPDRLDPWRAAEGKRRFSGSIPLARMVRLQELLADPQGEARFSATFELDRQDRVTIFVEVEAILTLQCQRSLEPYSETVQRNSLLAVIESMAEEKLLPENYEPVLVENRSLAIQDLVEDELILGVPQVPRNPQLKEIHPPSESAMVSDEPEPRQQMRQPFAGLAEQLKKLAQDAEN